MTPWLARLAVISTALPAVLLSVAYTSGVVSTWWLELLQYLPFPGFLVPAVLAFGLSFKLGRGWRLVAAITLVLVLTVLMGGVAGSADKGSGHVRMMTYNIKAYLAGHAAGAFAPLVREVAMQDPDILVMQDADQLTDQREQLPDTASPIFQGRQVFAFGQYLVVSRFPLRDCQGGQIPYRGEPHTYVRCVVTAQGVDVDLVTVHFKSPRDGLNATRFERSDGVDE